MERVSLYGDEFDSVIFGYSPLILSQKLRLPDTSAKVMAFFTCVRENRDGRAEWDRVQVQLLPWERKHQLLELLRSYRQEMGL